MAILDFTDSASVFSTPKPLLLIDRILKLSTGPNDLVLDFFAGSGTTAHAVLKLNAEDGGNRRFILVSNTESTADEPEKNLCRDVCAERVRRVIEGYGETPGTGGDFAYLRTRRIAPGKLLEIDHEQVWTALQLIHRETLIPYVKGRFLYSGDEDSALSRSMCPDFAARMRRTCARPSSGAQGVVIYSWQPELVRQHVRAMHVQGMNKSRKA